MDSPDVPAADENTLDAEVAFQVPKEEAIEIIKTWAKEAIVGLAAIASNGQPAQIILKGHRTPQFSGRQGLALSTIDECLSIADVLVRTLQKDATITKRGLFYQLLDTFATPELVVTRLNWLTETWGIPLTGAVVTAAPKGIFYGTGLKIELEKGLTVAGNDSIGQNIPSPKYIKRIIIDDNVRYLVVLGKHAVAHELAENKNKGFTSFHPDRGAGIMITGKGMPDLASCSLASRIEKENPNITVIGFFDCDGDGVGIMSFYKFGKAVNGNGLNLPSMCWGGVLPSELGTTIDISKTHPLSSDASEKIKNLIKAHPMCESLRNELTNLTQGGRKAGIEALGDRLSEYVGRKVLAILNRGERE